MMSEHTLNAEGLNCPLPILKARKMLNNMNQGETLKVRATDAGAVADFSAFCQQTGNDLLSSSSDGDVYLFEIRRA